MESRVGDLVYAVIVLVVLAVIGYAKGTIDARFGEPGFHSGGYWDGWHTWARAYLYLGCLGWMLPFTYPWWWNLFMLPLGALLNFASFRFAVYKAGKYKEWYGGE